MPAGVEPRREQQDVRELSPGSLDGGDAGVALPGDDPPPEGEQGRGGDHRESLVLHEDWTLVALVGPGRRVRAGGAVGGPDPGVRLS